MQSNCFSQLEIRDTVTNGFAVEGTLGADLMPDSIEKLKSCRNLK